MKYIAAILLSILAIVIIAAIVVPISLTALVSSLSFEDKSRIDIYFPDVKITQAIETKQWTNSGRDGSDHIYLKFKSKEEFEALIENRKTNSTLTHSSELIQSDFRYGDAGGPDWWKPESLKEPEILYNGCVYESERFPLKTPKDIIEVIYFSQQTLELYYAHITF